MFFHHRAQNPLHSLLTNASKIIWFPEVQNQNMLSGVARRGLPEPALIFQIQYRGDLFVLNVDTIRYRTEKTSDVKQFFFLHVSRKQEVERQEEDLREYQYTLIRYLCQSGILLQGYLNSELYLSLFHYLMNRI